MAVDQEIKVPDIGGASGVDVIDILVKEGDRVEKDASLITLESDKASMDIPSPVAGVVGSIKLKLGDKVSEGDVILTLSLDTAEASSTSAETKEHPKKEVSQELQQQSASEAAPVEAAEEKAPAQIASAPGVDVASERSDVSSLISASPSVRRLAHSLGINLTDVPGSGRKSRVSKEDIEQYVKRRLSEKTVSGGLAILASPAIDFSTFGEIETKPLNKIKRLTGANVHRAWVTIPHVTQFDLADITELEAFRKSETQSAQTKGYKLTILAFVCKVVCQALKGFPQFNASLDASGENLIYKHYFNIGIAVETPNGLVVPVIKEVNKLSIGDIAKEMARLSQKAREKGLMPQDMSGGCFTISSLGGIGGTAFTPIVNSPEVAILGLSRSSMQPVYQDGVFVPRLMLPLSLSYDHRVIDGAEAARFTRFISESLNDIRRVLL